MMKKVNPFPEALSGQTTSLTGPGLLSRDDWLWSCWTVLCVGFLSMLMLHSLIVVFESTAHADRLGLS